MNPKYIMLETDHDEGVIIDVTQVSAVYLKDVIVMVQMRGAENPLPIGLTTLDDAYRLFDRLQKAIEMLSLIPGR